VGLPSVLRPHGDAVRLFRGAGEIPDSVVVGLRQYWSIAPDGAVWFHGARNGIVSAHSEPPVRNLLARPKPGDAWPTPCCSRASSATRRSCATTTRTSGSCPRSPVSTAGRIVPRAARDVDHHERAAAEEGLALAGVRLSGSACARAAAWR
jgi:hypothetical protein